MWGEWWLLKWVGVPAQATHTYTPYGRDPARMARLGRMLGAGAGRPFPLQLRWSAVPAETGRLGPKRQPPPAKRRWRTLPSPSGTVVL